MIDVTIKTNKGPLTVFTNVADMPYSLFVDYKVQLQRYARLTQELAQADKLKNQYQRNKQKRKIEGKMQSARIEAIRVACDSPELIRYLTQNELLQAFNLLASNTFKFEPVERYGNGEDTERVAKAQALLHREQLEHDAGLIESYMNLRVVDESYIRRVAKKAKTGAGREAIKSAGCNLILAKAKRQELLNLTIEARHIRRPSPSFTHNGETYRIPTPTIKAIADDKLYKHYNVTEPKISVWQYRQIKEFQRNMGAQMERAMEDDNQRQIANLLYTDSLRQIAVLARKVKHTYTRPWYFPFVRQEKEILEEFPIDDKEVEAHIAERMQELKDVPVKTVLDTVFFLSNTYVDYVKTQSINTFGKAKNPRSSTLRGAMLKAKQLKRAVLRKAKELLEG